MANVYSSGDSVGVEAGLCGAVVRVGSRVGPVEREILRSAWRTAPLRMTMGAWKNGCARD